MTSGRRWALFSAGALLILVQLVRTAIDYRVVHHYTSWNFMLSGVVLAAGSMQSMDYWTAAYLQPLALTATPFVVMATAVMFGLDFGVVEDSFHKYPAAVVHLANLFLHGLPFVAVVSFVIFSLDYYRARLCATAWPAATQVAYVANTAILAFVYSASYFYTFSPQAEYKFTAYISNYTARTVSVLFHTLGTAAFAWVFMLYYHMTAPLEYSGKKY